MHKPIRKSVSGSAVILIFLVIVLGLSVFAWVKKQEIYDWARLRNYQPPDEIAQLAFDTTMNNSARRLFYVYHPELNDREAFNQNCSGFGEETIVLGCFVSPIGIYLYDIDDPRLHGVEQVTAAHEMLHAAYERLSAKEQTEVDALIEEAYKSLNDERIKRTIENYRLRDSSVVPNELHSILATEVRNLPPELEDYYKRYFTNRLAIVEFSEKYESELTKRRSKASALELQITSLRNQIEQQEKALSDERDSLRRDRDSVDSQEEAVAYNARVNVYNSKIRALNASIERHNALIAEYKSVSVETQELYKALDSRPTL